MRYHGGRNGAGTYQTIINQIPPHATFVELFAGSAAITRHKRPATRTILIDRDSHALSKIAHIVPVGTEPFFGNALDFLRKFPDCFSLGTFAYADPPYMNVRCRYAHDMSPAEHAVLLALLCQVPCAVMVSGYRSQLYNEMLAGWRRIDFQVVTRGGGMATESLWMNYPAPAVLHDPRYAGKDYRQRENLARKKKRWAERIARMPAAERQVLLEALTAGIDDEERDALLRNLAPPAKVPVSAGRSAPAKRARDDRD